MAGFVCGIVVPAYRTDAWPYAFYPLVETTLGIGIAWSISFVLKLFQIDESYRLPA